MTALEQLLSELRTSGTIHLVVAVLVVFLLVRLLGKKEHRRGFVRTLTPFTVHLLCALGAWSALLVGSTSHPWVHLAATIFAAITAVSLGAMVLFTLLLPPVGIVIPRVLRDATVGVGAVVVALVMTARAGFDITGVAATSAIVTAVVALSLQDTLGNIVGGLALELDNSIRVGEWIRLQETVGRVKEIRWRHTAIETRNGETLIVPNSALVKSHVLVLGRWGNDQTSTRRTIAFNVDFRAAPTRVIAAALSALAKEEIPGIAKEPPPDCVLLDLGDSFGRYAVRYWLTDLGNADGTDSKVRTRLVNGLRRRGLQLSIPALAVFATQETRSRKDEKRGEELERRQAFLHSLQLFSALGEDERLDVARCLHDSPYGPGEVLTRQGDVGHWLYFIVEGEVAIRVRTDGEEREVARLSAPSFFGEAALLTDLPRSATVVALSEVRCFRLGRADFLEIIKRRPDLKEALARIVAERQLRLLGTENPSASGAKKLEQTRTAFLTRMRRIIWPDG